MHEDIKVEWATLLAANVEKERLSKVADDLQRQTDEAYQAARDCYSIAAAGFADALNKMEVSLEEAAYVPALLKLTSEQVFIGVGGDYVLYLEGEKEHLLKPVDETGSRSCETHGESFSYPPVNLAPKGNPSEVPA